MGILLLSAVGPDQPIVLSGLASRRAFGTPSVGLTVHLTGLASRRAFGTLQVDQSIALTGLASRRAFGALSVGSDIQLTGLPSRRAFGTPIVAGPVILTGLASRRAFGTPSVGLTVHPAGLPSRRAFGTLDISLTVSPVGQPSRRAFGTLVVSIAQAVELFGLASRRAFGRTRVQLDGGTIAGSVDDARGPTTGGRPITILAPGVDMSAAEDRFSDGAIDLSLWTPVTTGSGSVRENAHYPSGSVQLTTGRAAGSTAILRSATTSERFDVGAEVHVPTVAFRNGTSDAAVWVAARASASTYARASVVLSDGGRTAVLRLESVVEGSTFESVDIPTVVSKSYGLRMLRNGRTIYVFFSGSLVAVMPWNEGDAAFEFGARNDEDSTGSSLTATLADYTRNPVILFGDSPMLVVRSKARGRIDGLTPSHATAEEVTVNVTTNFSSFDVSEQYTYEDTTDYLTVGTDGPSSLTVVSDAALRD